MSVNTIAPYYQQTQERVDEIEKELRDLPQKIENLISNLENEKSQYLNQKYNRAEMETRCLNYSKENQEIQNKAAKIQALHAKIRDERILLNGLLDSRNQDFFSNRHLELLTRQAPEHAHILQEVFEKRKRHQDELTGLFQRATQMLDGCLGRVKIWHKLRELYLITQNGGKPLTFCQKYIRNPKKAYFQNWLKDLQKKHPDLEKAKITFS